MLINIVYTFSIAFLVLFGSFSCTRNQPPQERVVNLAIWPNYISQETISGFEKTTGIKIQVSNYSSNEELLAKLQAGASGYDVALPSDYMVFVLKKLNLVEPLSHDQIPNLKVLDARYLNQPSDPGNRVSLPYDWGTTGLAVNRALYKGPLTSWKDLFSQPGLDGKFSLLDDMREVIGASLKSLGYSLNSKSSEELRQAKEVLLKTRKRVKAFTSEPISSLTNSEVAVAQSFMTDALLARKAAGDKIDYVFPSEGGIIWSDNLVIPRGAQNLKEAHILINYLLEPKVTAATVMTIFVAPVSSQTLSLVSESVRNNPTLFPSPEVLKNYERVEDLGESLALWDRVWTEIKVN